MTNPNTAVLAPAAATPDTTPHFEMHQCYISDCSVEMPYKGRTQEMMQRGDNDVQLSIESTVSRLSPEVLEMSLRCSARNMNKEGRVLFLVEVVQSGVFTCRNLPEQEMVENVNTAQIVHPYLRASFHDMMARAGLQPVILPELNYRAMYEEKKRQASEAAAPALPSANATKKLH